MTALLAAGYLIFGIASIAVLEGSLRTEMDAKLTTLARAASDIVDDDRGHAAVDADDVAQFNALHGGDEHLGVFTPGGRLLFGETIPTGTDAQALRFARAASLHNGHDLGFVVAWRNAGWIVTVRRTAVIAFIVTGVLLASLTFVFSGRYARAALVPIERVAALAERIEGSDLSQRLNAQGRDELARLCASFDRMLERLERSFEAERRFVGDASHELRAPLAVVRAETDLALRRERAPHDYRAALESIGRETTRLEAIVDDLLQTMRRPAPAHVTPVDAAELLSTVTSRLQPAAARLCVNNRARKTVVEADARSLERALIAVLHNALTHGGGAIDVALDDDEAALRIHVMDRGPGFSQQALAHATERFWRGDTSRSRGGTGLGLSIATVLVEANGGSLALANSDRGGAVVTIALPRSGNGSPA